MSDAATADDADLSPEWSAALDALRDRHEATLAAWGCVPIEIAVGSQQFDPDIHEAVEPLSGEKVPAGNKKNTIVRVRRRGWKLHDHILQLKAV